MAEAAQAGNTDAGLDADLHARLQLAVAAHGQVGGFVAGTTQTVPGPAKDPAATKPPVPKTPVDEYLFYGQVDVAHVGLWNADLEGAPGRASSGRTVSKQFTACPGQDLVQVTGHVIR